MNLRDRAIREHADRAADWAKHLGYRGRIYYRWRDQLCAVVHENLVLRTARFEVHHWGRVESKHATLAAAQRRVLELLLAELQ